MSGSYLWLTESKDWRWTNAAAYETIITVGGGGEMDLKKMFNRLCRAKLQPVKQRKNRGP